MKTKFANIILIITGTGILLWIFGGIIFYGSFTGWMKKCAYTENIIEIPKDLINSSIVLEKDEYIARGENLDHCTETFAAIENEIVDLETINNNTIGKKYFERQGRSVEAFPKGKKFTLDKIVAENKHGFSAVDSGYGPLVYVMLRDEKGIEYEIATPSLGYDEKESFLSYYKDGIKLGSLNWSYFRNFK